MNDRFFIDTNIFVYSFDNKSLKKRNTAREIIAGALKTSNGCISFQVVQEFLSVALRKFEKPFSAADAQLYLKEVLLPLCDIFPGNEFYASALDIQERCGYSFYDSMILQAAREADCRILYSEDFQNGFKLYDVTIKNPFL